MLVDALWIVVVAGGSGRRLGGETPKQYLPLAGRPLFLHCLERFVAMVPAERLVLVHPAGDEARIRALLPPALAGLRLTTGGATRQASVAAGLAAIPAEEGIVAVHDAARPFPPADALHNWIVHLQAAGNVGLLPVLPLSDTILQRVGNRVVGHVDRDVLGRAQTPQLFPLPLLRAAHGAAIERGETNASDDASLLLAIGKELFAMPGDPANVKITTAADLAAAERVLGAPALRVGQGYDSHRLDPARPLVLGGVTVPSDVGGLAGHSDADVLTHAIMDALLGAAGLGDIGRHFPDTDPVFAGADSVVLLAQVRSLLAGAGLAPWQVDATVIAERPKLAPHIDAMRARLADTLGLPASRVSVKATTNERMGAIGRGEGMAAMAIAVLRELP
ncbi:2-C-methyl-D-erythritol 2,4-cyclodiphosphate synthase [bacterium]|nr:2-C-methyl-D-erythritol 2,4-cyclodiphosphate synthase [bacterium]